MLSSGGGTGLGALAAAVEAAPGRSTEGDDASAIGGGAAGTPDLQPSIDTDAAKQTDGTSRIPNVRRAVVVDMGAP